MAPFKRLGLILACTTAMAAPAVAERSFHRGGDGAAIVYAHPDFRGQSLRVTGPITHLNRYRFNDKASSIRVTGGSWEVCVDPNFRGRCEIISYREGQLNDYRLNDKITSIRPVTYRGGRYDRDDRYRDWGRNHRRGDDHYRGGRDHEYGRRHGGYARNAPVVLFQHPGFRGDALPVDGAIPHLNRLRFNDKVSSIAINGGAWEVCSDPNFRGRCEVITGSVDNTSYYRLNDNITSIRPAGRHYGKRW